jgi:peroxidase
MCQSHSVLVSLFLSQTEPMNQRPLVLSLVLVLGITVSLAAENRSFNGTGNNQANPSWGSAGQNFTRLDDAHYADMLSVPSGPTRPNARDISNGIGTQAWSMPDAAMRSDYVWQWGQFLDHDITLTAGGSSEFMPIMVGSPADPLFPMIPMNRSGFDPATGVVNPREQFNENSAYVDASMVYGSNATRADALRTHTGGQLATTSGGMMLPYNTGLLPNANGGVEPDETLFLAGDVRANEQLGLTSMHTLFVREHNRLAADISASNPGWTDEQVYQQTRKIVGAMVQNITYREFLPSLLGDAAPSLDSAAYGSTVDATLSNEFATAAYRLGHTQVSSQLVRLDHTGNPAPGGNVDLTDAFFVPSFLTSPDEVDFLLHGLATQVQQTTDVHMIDALRNAMFGPPGSGGLDLLSINIQRGRDHGLGTLTELQDELGISVAMSFEDITSDPALQSQLALLYADVTEVDLWIGLLAEDAMSGSAVGPTMSRVIADQFENLMVGDRFFFLWDDDLSADEVEMIAGTRLSDIILRNTGITGLLGNVFFVPEPSGGLLLFLGLALLRRRR